MIMIVQVKLMVVARLKVIVTGVPVRVSVAYRLDGQRKMTEYQENGKVKVGY